MTTNKRISYYDIAKGILICLVILSHIYVETLHVAKIPNSTFSWLRSYQWIYTSFFMPAFFIITGLCSNFNKPFKLFFYTNFRALIIPALFFDFFCYTIPNMFESPNIANDLYKFIYRVFTMGGIFWFFPCLFCSKIIFWILKKYTKGFIFWIILVILFILGFFIDQSDLPIKKMWYICQVFDMTLFLGIGLVFKNISTHKNIYYFCGMIVYFLCTLYFIISNNYFPSVFFTYNIYEWKQLPLHFFLSITGTLSVLFISKKINNNSILEYLGKGTIVIYGVNNLILKIVLIPLGTFIAYKSFLASIIIIVIILFITLILCVFAIQFFNLRFIRFILGKK